MRCQDTALPIQSLTDGESGPIDRWRLQRHLAGCAVCSARLAEAQHLRDALRSHLPRYQASPDLAARIGRALAQEALPIAPPRPRALGWSLAGGSLAGALAGVALTLLVTGHNPEPAHPDLDDQLIGSHLRSLMGDHLVDIPTSDRHTVKPWLSARLNVSPPVRELESAGFPLVGGRLDYVEGRPAAAVVYRRRQHVINLFAWPTTGPDEPMRIAAQQGFNLITWTQGGTRLAAVSDLNVAELREFAALIAQP